MSQAALSITTPFLTIEDVKTVDDLPRLMDLRLAAALGFADAHKIRDLIGRNLAALERLGAISATVAENTGKRGRPGKTYWLNKKQALFLCTKSETEKATETTIQMVEVFDAYTEKRAADFGVQPDELWIYFGKEAVMVDRAARFIDAGQRGVICDHFGKLRVVAGPLTPCEPKYKGQKLVLMKARKQPGCRVSDAVTLIGRVVPFVPRWIVA